MKRSRFTEEQIMAMHVWPDAPRHSNQVLRYWRNLVLDNALAMLPHRAGPDAWVTAQPWVTSQPFRSTPRDLQTATVRP